MGRPITQREQLGPVLALVTPGEARTTPGRVRRKSETITLHEVHHNEWTHY